LIDTRTAERDNVRAAQIESCRKDVDGIAST
jgi:hypothetical protein